jgi:hypothetical protein
VSAVLFLGACEGVGDGQVSGTLFLRGCPDLDPTTAGSSDLPSPLPAFRLDPQYFFGEVLRAAESGLGATDPRGSDSMHIRLQRNSSRAERADTFDLFIHDLDRLPAVQDAALRRGEPGAPILPPPVSGTAVPLPSDPGVSVRAALSLNVSCWFPRVQPALRGSVYFSSLGRELGDQVAGRIEVTVEDERAIREQGSPPPAPDAAGALSGWFSFPLRSGPVVPPL